MDIENPRIARALELAAKQAIDLINGGYLSAEEVIEVYTTVASGIGVTISSGRDIADYFREVASNAESELHLKDAH